MKLKILNHSYNVVTNLKVNANYSNSLYLMRNLSLSP